MIRSVSVWTLVVSLGTLVILGIPETVRGGGGLRTVEKLKHVKAVVAESDAVPSPSKDADDEVPNLILAELGGVGYPSSGEHGYCELCIYALHQVQYGELPSCQGSSRAASYDSCAQVTQSILAFAQDVMHLLSYGCYSYDAYEGWQTVKPCPAHVVCGRLPNVYDTQQQTMCPADFHYRFPHALGNRAPTVFNPLLKYAVSQYKGVGLSSVLQSPGMPANLPRFKRETTQVRAAIPGASNAAFISGQSPRAADGLSVAPPQSAVWSR